MHNIHGSIIVAGILLCTVVITVDENIYAIDSSDALMNFYSAEVQEGQIAIMWLGNHKGAMKDFASAGFMIKTSEHVVAIDPSNLLSDDIHNLQEIDVILITHEHGDHYDPETTIKMQQKTGASVIANPGASPALMGNIPDDKLTQMSPNESISLVGIDVTSFPAEHPANIPLLYVIEVDGFRIFHGSDSAFVEDLSNIESRVHVALVPTGDPSPTASPSDAFEMVKAVQPYIVMTMHGNPDQMQTLADMVKESKIQSKVIKPEPLEVVIPVEVVPEFPITQLIMVISFVATISIAAQVVRRT
ncbi:MAG: MBL fold metallo-hydrolase [Nitrososphaerales archaeon]